MADANNKQAGLVRTYLDGRISRREFMACAIALGLSTTTISAILAGFEDARADQRTSGPVVGEGHTVFYVSPDGDDSSQGTRHKPFRTIERARDVVRERNHDMRKNIVVYLYGGTYELADTLLFTGKDSGTSGHSVIYSAVSGESPLISGGRRITGWKLHDAAKNIYKAFVGMETDIRQLWVNGRRATRARSQRTPAGFELTETGYIYTGTEFDFTNWHNLSDVEVVSYRRWRAYRCPIASATRTDSETVIEMQTPCWTYAYSDHKPWGNVTIPVWIENAYELLDEEGEWYLDRSSGYLYYKPLDREDMASTEVVLPSLETLLEVRGTADEPVRDLQFEGLTFSHATWLEPNSSTGFSVIQAGYHYGPEGQQEKMPANITMTGTRNISFHRCCFTHLGGSGLELEYGTQHATIKGNRFTDISGNAIQVSGADKIHHHPDDERDVVLDNEISNNYIADVATEYQGCVGIWQGYADSTRIAHNTIHDLPYSAVSVGWGWGGYTTPTTARNNSISYNHIYDFTKTLIDSGGVYTLSAQPNSEISNNFIYKLVLNHHDNSLVYTDEATRYFTVTDNVLCETPRWWLKIWTSSIRNNIATDNYTDKDNV